MSVTDEAVRRRADRWFGWLKHIHIRFALIGGALVLAGFWAVGLISVLAALACYALVITAALIGRGEGNIEAARVAASRFEAPALRLGDPPIEAVLSGFP